MTNFSAILLELVVAALAMAFLFVVFALRPAEHGSCGSASSCGSCGGECESCFGGSDPASCDLMDPTLALAAPTPEGADDTFWPRHKDPHIRTAPEVIR